MLLTEHFPSGLLLVLNFDQKHVNWKLTFVAKHFLYISFLSFL